MTYPETLNELEKELAIHAKDGRSDDIFRFAIMSSQVGSLAAHLTHDPAINPTARPYGTKDGEISDAGHALVQLMTYCVLRDIPLQKAVNSALENLRGKDFIKKISKSNNSIVGEIANDRGYIKGIAFVDPYCKNLKDMPFGHILVAIHPTNAISPFNHKLNGIVTDEGGIACHAAILSRESDIPCIVGTGNATNLLKTGDLIAFQNTAVLKLENHHAD